MTWIPAALDVSRNGEGQVCFGVQGGDGKGVSFISSHLTRARNSNNPVFREAGLVGQSLGLSCRGPWCVVMLLPGPQELPPSLSWTVIMSSTLSTVSYLAAFAKGSLHPLLLLKSPWSTGSHLKSQEWASTHITVTTASDWTWTEPDQLTPLLHMPVHRYPMYFFHH